MIQDPWWEVPNHREPDHGSIPYDLNPQDRTHEDRVQEELDHDLSYQGPDHYVCNRICLFRELASEDRGH